MRPMEVLKRLLELSLRDMKFILSIASASFPMWLYGVYFDYRNVRPQPLVCGKLLRQDLVF
nr:MAG TPA: hypothetical protein [Caudoviricetes sp.]